MLQVSGHCPDWSTFTKATLFFHKNLFYKNVEAEIDPDVKNMHAKNVPNLRLRDKAFLFSSEPVFASG